MKNKTYESKSSCIVCGVRGEGLVTAHHLSSRGSGGSDKPHNLLSVCLPHHNEVHSLGLTSFVKKYSAVEGWMLHNDWYFVELTCKWKHD